MSDVESLPVELIVQYPPAEGYPQCFPNFGRTQGLHVGQQLKFGCSTEKGEPAAQLRWTLNGTELESDVDTSTTSFISMNFVRNITVDDHGMTFDCTLTHELLEGPRICVVGPLDVLFPPIETKITNTQPVLKVGSNLVLSCEAKSNPISMDFKWYTFPPIDPGRDLSMVAHVWLLSDLEAEDDGTVVTCEARNNMGALNTSFTIAVTYTLPTPPPAPKTPPQPIPSTTTIFATPYVIILILIAVALLLLAMTLAIIAARRKKRPAPAIITVAKLDSLHADVHSLASFGNVSRHGTPYLDRVDYELNRSRSHSRDMFDTESLDSASALVMRTRSSNSPTHRKYSVDSLGKTKHMIYTRPSNGSPVHQSAKQVDSSPYKEHQPSESAHSQACRPLPQIAGPVQQNEYAELTPVSARKQYNESKSLSMSSPESGFGEDDALIKSKDNNFSLHFSNNCNCSRQMSHFEV